MVDTVNDSTQNTEPETLPAWKKNLVASVEKSTEDSLSESINTVQSTEMDEQESDSADSTHSTEAQSSDISNKKKWWQRRIWQISLGIVLFFLVVGGVFATVGFLVYQQALVMQNQAMEAVSESRLLYTAFKGQNLVESKERLNKVQGKVLEMQETYAGLKWVSNIPVAKSYYEDGEHAFIAAVAGTNAALKGIAAIEPHADLLGFGGEGTFTGTTEDRIGVVLETLNQISPALDDIAADIEIVQENLDAIDANRYPEVFKGYEIRSQIVKVQEYAQAAEVALNEARPAVERLPEVAGAGERRKYLVIFQNDNELRPTGGFMTAYAVVFVENGKVTPEKSDDIYELDQKFRAKPPIPPELGRFLITERKWNLRDMNIDPSFKNSMETFYEYYQQVPGEPDDIDGIIAVDTVFLEKVVEVLGPIDVPGYGVFSAEKIARCDCPQIIYALSEIIDRPTPYIREDRKGILAPMMQSIIQKTYATDRNKWPQLAELLWQGIEGRHLQFYFMNEEDQNAAELIGAAGIIPDLPKSGDYLTVIDANLAGAKSNLFVKTSGVIDVLGIENGKVRKQVELTYRNTHPASNCNLEAGELCLNGLLNDWTRWYVPKGAEVEEVLGLEQGYEVDTSHAEFDIIEGIFRVSPLGQTKVRITYSVPYSGEANSYHLRMQKQGGTDDFPYELTTPWGETEFVLSKDVNVRVAQ